MCFHSRQFPIHGIHQLTAMPQIPYLYLFLLIFQQHPILICPVSVSYNKHPYANRKLVLHFANKCGAFWPIPFLMFPVTKNRQLQKKILKFASPRNDKVTVERKDCRKEAILYAPCIELRLTLNFTNRPEGRKFPRKGEETCLIQLHLPQE